MGGYGQPTLHAASMQARQIIVSPNKTFQFNLATTKAFNADFDGDEINVSFKQVAADMVE